MIKLATLSTLKKKIFSSMYLKLWVVAGSMAIVIGLGFLVRNQPGATKASASKSSSSAARAKASNGAVPTATVDGAQPTAPTSVSTPGQAKVYDGKGGLLATFTVGSRTVLMNGPQRKFSEPSSTDVTVTTNAWVRLYPTVFDGNVDKNWVSQMVDLNKTNKTPDILGTAMQYVVGASPVKDANGRVIAGDASFGPLGADNKREEGADFNDFLGVPWTYGSVVDRPEPKQIGSLDCSGFQRMVWGYRNGLSLALSSAGGAMSRQAHQIYKSGPGVVLIPDSKRQVTDFSRIQIGDVAFLDVDANDGTQIDHMGIYFGVDSEGHHRFLSSRKTANGPTFGDIDGKSILDGNVYFAQKFRAVRRF